MRVGRIPGVGRSLGGSNRWPGFKEMIELGGKDFEKTHVIYLVIY
jgi:hypothetical protein